jgi:large subunit ribosomal protein L1
VGKLSFAAQNLVANIKALLVAITRAKPATAKGQYMRGLYLSSTMGPGLKIELKDLDVI